MKSKLPECFCISGLNTPINNVWSRISHPHVLITRYNHKVHCHFAVVRCRAFAKWNGMEANTTMRTAGTTVNVTCGETLMFPDRQPYKTAACDDEGSWRPEVPDCIGKCEAREWPIHPSGRNMVATFGTKDSCNRTTGRHINRIFAYRTYL